MSYTISNKSSITSKGLEDTISALREIIKTQQTINNIPTHEPTSTEYFAIISTTISVGKGGDNLPELLKVLLGVIPNTSKNILRSQFKNVSHSLLNLLKVYNDNELITSTTLSVLGTLMMDQDCSDGFWDNMSALQSINAILSFSDSENSRHRKITNDIIMLLLKKHQQHKTNSLRSYISDFCIGVILNCSRAAYKRSLFIILILENIVVFVPENKLLPILDSSLRLQICEIPKLTAAVYRMYDALFQSPYYTFTSIPSKQVLELLLQSKPNTFDMEANTYYCTALASGLVCLRKINRLLSVDIVNPIIIELASMLDSEFIQVHCAVSTAIKRILCTIFARALIKINKTKDENPATSSSTVEEASLQSVLDNLTSIFQLKYQRSWLYMLDAIRSLFELYKSNGKSCKQLSSVIQAVAQVYQAVELGTLSNIDTVVHLGLGETLGSALQACGLKLFLEIIPLATDNPTNNSSNNELLITTNREWIINLLHCNLKYMPCLLSDFGNCILPIASHYNTLITQAATTTTSSTTNAEAKLLRTRVTQLWSLLPEMCCFQAKDIVESFPRLSPVLERLFSDVDYSELLTCYVVNSLYYLAKGVRQRCPKQQQLQQHVQTNEFVTAELTALRSTAFTYLPLVLQYIENLSIGDTKFQEGVQCISVWCDIAPPSLVAAISKKLLQLVLSTTSITDGQQGDNNAAAGWMAVMLAIIPLLQDNLVQLLFRSIRPLLTASDTSSVQKRAYNLLFSLLNTHRDIIFKLEDGMNIFRAISEALLTCHVSSRTVRFRCLESLLKGLTMIQLKEALNLISHEVLICLKDSNKKSRDGAMDILKYFIHSLHAEDVMIVLQHALTTGSTSIIRSSAITGLCLLILHQRDNIHILNKAIELLVPVGSMLVKGRGCPHETKAVLTYIKVFVSVQPKQTICDLLYEIVMSFTESLGSHKPKFASRCRAIMRKLLSKLGEDILRPIVPASDIALLDYVCKYARKAELRNKNKGKLTKIEHMLGSDSDNNSDEDDMNEDMNDDIDDNDDDLQNTIMNITSTTNNNTSSVQHDIQEDYRLGVRPKANRALSTSSNQGSTIHSWLPSSIDDLLEDQPSTLNKFQASNTNHTNNSNGVIGSKRGRNYNDSDNHHHHKNNNSISSSSMMLIDENDPYQVIVNAEGKVVVKEIEIDKSLTIDNNDNNQNNSQVDTTNSLHSKDIINNKTNKINKKRKLNLKEPGIEYRSKKSGGDIWKKGMLEPHAFIPLDPRLLSKKHNYQAIQHFGIVIKKKDGKNKRKNNLIQQNNINKKSNKKSGLHSNKSKKNNRK